MLESTYIKLKKNLKKFKNFFFCGGGGGNENAVARQYHDGFYGGIAECRR